MNTETIRYKKKIIEIGQKLYLKGYADGTSGNISQKFDKGCLVTCTGTNLGSLGMDDIVYVPFEKTSRARFHKAPTSEFFMHVALYLKRPEVTAIVHAHPPYSSAFGIARVSLSPPLLPEVMLQLGEIPIVEYSMPSTEELAYKIAGEAAECNGLLMANHGSVTLGQGLDEAYYRMETLESYAKIVYLAKTLGHTQQIPSHEMDKLKEIRTQILQKSRV